MDTSGLKGTISSSNVGTYDKVTLPELTLAGEQAGNYTLIQPTGAVDFSVEIKKETYTGDTTAASSARFGAIGTCDLTALLQDIDGAALGTPAASGNIFEGGLSVSGKTLSYTLINDAAKVNSTGVITVPVTSANYKDFNLTITVTAPDKDVPTLTINAITVTYNGEAVPDSAIKGAATVEIVDNSKPFADMPAGSWEADAVAFASAHELFNGTGANRFSPSLPMSRGMLAAVFHNLESNPPQPVGGILDPAGQATRAEAAQMLKNFMERT